MDTECGECRQSQTAMLRKGVNIMNQNERISLSNGEWKLMNLLWNQAPRTIMELTRLLEPETGWSKNAVITMLNRLEAKKAVYHEAGERAKQFYPLIEREEAALAETRGFLNRVYKGSLSLMVDAMASSKKLSRREIEELYEILRRAEEDACD